RPMAMGKRKRGRQPSMWVTATDLPTAASHPFYRGLNQLLHEHGFDGFAEAQCVSFYAETMGRPSLPPGILFPAAVDWLLRGHRLRARPFNLGLWTRTLFGIGNTTRPPGPQSPWGR